MPPKSFLSIIIIFSG